VSGRRTVRRVGIVILSIVVAVWVIYILSLAVGSAYERLTHVLLNPIWWIFIAGLIALILWKPKPR